MSNQETLKGGISYNRYVWRASANACEKCQSLDGAEYNSADEIPDFPHPNCKCYIDIIEEDENNNDKQQKRTSRPL